MFVAYCVNDIIYFTIRCLVLAKDIMKCFKKKKLLVWLLVLSGQQPIFFFRKRELIFNIYKLSNHGMVQNATYQNIIFFFRGQPR